MSEDRIAVLRAHRALYDLDARGLLRSTTPVIAQSTLSSSGMSGRAYGGYGDSNASLGPGAIRTQPVREST